MKKLRKKVLSLLTAIMSLSCNSGFRSEAVRNINGIKVYGENECPKLGPAVFKDKNGYLLGQGLRYLNVNDNGASVCDKPSVKHEGESYCRFNVDVKNNTKSKIVEHPGLQVLKSVLADPNYHIIEEKANPGVVELIKTKDGQQIPVGIYTAVNGDAAKEVNPVGIEAVEIDPELKYACELADKNIRNFNGKKTLEEYALLNQPLEVQLSSFRFSKNLIENLIGTENYNEKLMKPDFEPYALKLERVKKSAPEEYQTRNLINNIKCRLKDKYNFKGQNLENQQLEVSLKKEVPSEKVKDNSIVDNVIKGMVPVGAVIAIVLASSLVRSSDGEVDWDYDMND